MGAQGESGLENLAVPFPLSRPLFSVAVGVTACATPGRRSVVFYSPLLRWIGLNWSLFCLFDSIGLGGILVEPSFSSISLYLRTLSAPDTREEE